jgi:hypothetical protein
MTIKKRNTLFLSIISLSVLTLLILNRNKNNEVSSQLINTSNVYLPKLPEKYAKQYENKTLIKYSKTNYSAKFYESDFERQLVLIIKNPSVSQKRTKPFVHLYPKSKFLNAKNYNKKGFLDYSTQLNPIMYTYSNDVYAVRIINLPFINIDKILVLQSGIWKHIFDKPFKDLPKTNLNIQTDFYSEIFQKTLQEYDIKSQKNSDNSKITFCIINRFDVFLKFIYKKDKKTLKYIIFKGKNKNQINKLIDKFLKNELSFSEVFDCQKLATYKAIVNLFSNNKTKKIGFIYNEQTHILEPFDLNNHKLGVFEYLCKR